MPATRKLAYGEGTVRLDKSRGTYLAQLVGPDGKRYSRRRRTRRDAIEALDALRDELENGPVEVETPPTVGEWLPEWLGRQRKKSAPTLDNYRWAIDHLEPLYRHQLDQLSAHRIEDVLTTKARAGLGHSALVRLRTVLAMAIDDAMRRRVPGIVFNPARLAELPETTKTRREKRALSVDEAWALLEAAQKDRCSPLVVVPMFLALRPGEVAALRWSDLDLDEGILAVTQQRRREPDGTLTMTEPKAKSAGRVRMPFAVAEHLKAHKRRQAAERMAHRREWTDNDLVVCTTTGAPLDPSNVRRTIARLCRDAGIFDPITPNEIRHTAATLAAREAQVPLEQLRYMMRHKDQRMLEKHYVHTPELADGTHLQAVLGGAL